MRTLILVLIATLAAGYWTATAPLNCTQFRTHISGSRIEKKECIENPVMGLLWDLRYYR